MSCGVMSTPVFESYITHAVMKKGPARAGLFFQDFDAVPSRMAGLADLLEQIPALFGRGQLQQGNEFLQ